MIFQRYFILSDAFVFAFNYLSGFIARGVFFLGAQKRDKQFSFANRIQRKNGSVVTVAVIW